MKSAEFITEEFKKKKGTYAGLRFSRDTIKKLIEYAERNNIPNVLKEDDFHSTLLYSRKFLPEYEPLGELSSPLKATPNKIEIWESPPNAFKEEATNCLILLYDCEDQVNRFNTLMSEHEATYDYDEYKPHVTLSYDVGDLQVENLEDASAIGEIEIIDEYTEELDLDKTFTD